MSITFEGVEIRTRPITMVKTSCGCHYNAEGHGTVVVGDVVHCPEFGGCGAANEHDETTVLQVFETEVTV